MIKYPSNIFIKIIRYALVISIFLLILECSKNIVAANDPNNNCISLADYDAVGDGKTDNYIAITNAISDAITNKKNLIIPSGSFYTSKMIVIYDSLKIIGQDSSSSIVFRDLTQYSDMPKYLQRGLLSFKGNGLTLEKITLKYESDNTTPYTHNKNTSGQDGVLFSVIDSSNITLNNVKFEIRGKNNPSITCAWFKSETKDIANVEINNCIFEHNSNSYYGGSLWLSSHDNIETSLHTIKIYNCTFNEYAHDETLGIWGYKVSDINILNNNFNYIGTDTFSESLVTLYGVENSCFFSNVSLNNNNFTIKNNVRNAILVNQLPNNSFVSIKDNTISASLLPDQEFCSIGLSNCGNTVLSNNTINTVGGKIISFALYDKGGTVSSEKTLFNAQNCKHCLIIRSRFSSNFSGGKFIIDNSDFIIASSNSTSGISTIQYPAGSLLTISNSTLSTANSSIHEFVIQTLSKPILSATNNQLSINSFATDTSLFLNMNEVSKRSVTIENSNFVNIKCIVSNAEEIDNFAFNNCKYSSFSMIVK